MRSRELFSASFLFAASTPFTEVTVPESQPPLFDLPEPAGTTAMAVFKYWANTRHHALGLNGQGPKQVPTARRLSKIKARLAEGYTVDQLKAAIDGVLASDYHLKGGYTDIELICRDQSHVERYMLRAPQRGERSAQGKVTSASSAARFYR